MHITGIGELHHNSRIEKWLDSEAVPIPFLGGQPLVITFMDIVDETSLKESEEAINNFLALTTGDRDKTNQLVFANYKQFVEYIGEGEFDFTIKSPKTVWKRVHPTDILVSRNPRGDKAIYVALIADCDWETEHGLQLVFRYGKELTRVSEADGHLT